MRPFVETSLRHVSVPGQTHYHDYYPCTPVAAITVAIAPTTTPRQDAYDHQENCYYYHCFSYYCYRDYYYDYHPRDEDNHYHNYYDDDGDDYDYDYDAWH